MFGHQDEPKNPVNDSTTAAVPANDMDTTSVTPSSPAVSDSAADAAVSAPPAVSLPSPSGSTMSPDALLDIKQQALQQLTPLVGHLEQNPEEKFRTTMMMIQAS